MSNTENQSATIAEIDAVELALSKMNKDEIISCLFGTLERFGSEFVADFIARAFPEGLK